ncbi:unnamed protein product [Arctogadus glacialis]
MERFLSPTAPLLILSCLGFSRVFGDSLAAPFNVTLRDLKANSAVVTWDIPEADFAIGFAITQQKKYGRMLRFIQEVNTTTNSCALWDLEEETDYIVHVQSIGMLGPSPQSKPLNFRTPKEAETLASESNERFRGSPLLSVAEAGTCGKGELVGRKAFEAEGSREGVRVRRDSTPREASAGKRREENDSGTAVTTRPRWSTGPNNIRGICEDASVRVLACKYEVTMEEVGQSAQLRAGELIIIVVVLIMWAGVIALFCRQYDIIKDNEPSTNKDKAKSSSECSTPEHLSGGLLRSKHPRNNNNNNRTPSVNIIEL